MRTIFIYLFTFGLFMYVYCKLYLFIEKIDKL